MLESATGKSDGEAAADDAADGDAGAAGGASVVVQLPAGAVDNREAAVEAMHAAAKYFALMEPSSPVPILLREAQNAASKSFYELVNDLMPDTAASAFVTLGREPWFEVQLSMLDQRNPAPDYENDEAVAEEESSSWENAGLEDDSMSDNDMPDGNDAPVGNDEWSESTAAPEDDQGGESETVSDEDPAAETMEASNDAPEELAADDSDSASSWGDANDTPEADASENQAEAEAEPEPEPEPEDTGPRFVANSRPEAIDLMNKVLTFYRVAEPSSPVSLIIERALELSSKNFIELLGNVLPDGSLKVKPSEDSSSSGW